MVALGIAGIFVPSTSAFGPGSLPQIYCDFDNVLTVPSSLYSFSQCQQTAVSNLSFVLSKLVARQFLLLASHLNIIICGAVLHRTLPIPCPRHVLCAYQYNSRHLVVRIDPSTHPHPPTTGTQSNLTKCRLR